MIGGRQTRWRKTNNVANFGFMESKDKPVTFIIFLKNTNEELFLIESYLLTQIKLNLCCKMAIQYFRGCELFCAQSITWEMIFQRLCLQLKQFRGIPRIYIYGFWRKLLVSSEHNCEARHTGRVTKVGAKFNSLPTLSKSCHFQPGLQICNWSVYPTPSPLKIKKMSFSAWSSHFQFFSLSLVHPLKMKKEMPILGRSSYLHWNGWPPHPLPIDCHFPSDSSVQFLA